MRQTVSIGTSKTRKIIDIRLPGEQHIECIVKSGDPHPYRTYLLVPSHKRQIAKHSDFCSVFYFLKEYYEQGINTKTIAETISWSKEWGSL